MHTTAHKHQNEPLPPYPPAVLPSLSMGRAAVLPTHGAAASHNLAQCVRDRVRQHHGWLPCLGSQCKPHQKIERKAGPCLMMANNNQPDSGRNGRGDVRAEARWAGSMWGDAITSYGASNGVAKKIKMKYTMALNGCQLIILHTTINQK